MKITKALIAILAAAGLFAFTAPADANWHGGGWHGGGFHGHGHFVVRAGFPFWGWGYPYWGWGYPYGYYPPPYYGYGQQGVYQGQMANPPSQTNDGGKDYSMAARVQRQLSAQGYYHGHVDGVIGSGTRSAIRQYQRANGLAVDGEIGGELLNSMGLG